MTTQTQPQETKLELPFVTVKTQVLVDLRDWGNKIPTVYGVEVLNWVDGIIKENVDLKKKKEDEIKSKITTKAS